jgi:hypothetical protein
VKKYLAILLGVFLILSFAITANAQDKPEITLGGKILVRGWYWDNIPGSNLPEKSQSQAVYSTNLFLTLDAKVSDNVKGFIELETCNNDQGTSGLYFWGEQGYDTKAKPYMFFRQLWIQYTGSGLFGVPAGMKVGHMPIALGEKQFLRNERFGDDAILLWLDPTKELHLAIGTAKLAEESWRIHSDDIDGHILIATYAIDPNITMGANYTLVHSDRSANDALNLHNLGVHANGKAAGLSYAAEVDYQFGKSNNIVGDDDKFRGWGIYAKLGYAIDPINIRGSFAMGSGDKDLGDNKIKEFQTIVGNDTQSLFARFPNYTLVYERAVRTAAQNQVLTGNSRTTGIANTTYYNVGMDITPIKELSLTADAFLIRATKSNVSKKVGTEVDVTANYKIAKNLSYFVQAGVFWPGKYYEETDWDNNPATRLDKKNVVHAVHGLSLSF